jgi:hypothetical protein
MTRGRHTRTVSPAPPTSQGQMMITPLRRTPDSLALALVALVALVVATGCKSDSTTEVTVAPGTLGGWVFSLSGATIKPLFGVLPAATSGFAGPVVKLDRQPGATTSATISVGAAEPFNTIYVLPNGASQYLQVSLPATTTLIGLEMIGATGATTTATSLKIAVANGARTSTESTLLLLVPVVN